MEEELRKPGVKMTDEKKKKKSLKEVIDSIPRLIRSDFGGATKEEKPRAALAGAIRRSSDTNLSRLIGKLEKEDQLSFAMALIQTAEHTAEGCRDRTSRYIKELRDRLLEKTEEKENDIIKI